MLRPLETITRVRGLIHDLERNIVPDNGIVQDGENYLKTFVLYEHLRGLEKAMNLELLRQLAHTENELSTEDVQEMFKLIYDLLWALNHP